MLLNNTRDDLERLCIGKYKTKSQLANDAGINRQSLQSCLTGGWPTRLYVRLVEVLGYDIELRYVKRTDDGSK